MATIRVLGVVPNVSLAEQVVGNLRLAGFGQNDVAFIVVEPEEVSALDKKAADQTGQGSKNVAWGMLRGAVVGAIVGIALGFLAHLIPFLGEVLALGILMALFGGVGAIVGALAGAFSTETPANQVVQRYGMELRVGQVIVSVDAPDQDIAKRAEEILNTSGAGKVNSFIVQGDTFRDQIEEMPGVTKLPPRQAKQRF